MTGTVLARLPQLRQRDAGGHLHDESGDVVDDGDDQDGPDNPASVVVREDAEVENQDGYLGQGEADHVATLHSKDDLVRARARVS